MASLDLGQYLGGIVKGVPQRWQMVSHALSTMQDAINNLGNHIAADAIGTAEPPPPIQGLDVKTVGETVHAVIRDNNPIRKGVHYFLEADNDPSFPQPHVVHLGASRSALPFTLPAKTDGGDAQKWYLRAYSQYPGSDPGPKVNHGGIQPAVISPSGTTQMTLLPSTGSGSAQATGQQGGYGFGKVPKRGPVMPKRFIPL